MLKNQRQKHQFSNDDDVGSMQQQPESEPDTKHKNSKRNTTFSHRQQPNIFVGEKVVRVPTKPKICTTMLSQISSLTQPQKTYHLIDNVDSAYNLIWSWIFLHSLPSDMVICTFAGAFSHLTQMSTGWCKSWKKLKVKEFSITKIPKCVHPGWNLLNSYCVTLKF